MDASVQELLDLEWRLFDEAPQAGRRPEDREFFTIARSSQLAAWMPELRASWRQDLLDAQAEGRNPINEKYIYMLERTDPERYAAAKNTLPTPSLEKLWLADWICQALAPWQEALVKKYSRLTPSRESGPFKAFLWGDLMACSVKTLRLYASQIERLQKAGGSLCEAIWENALQQLGTGSFELVEKSIL